MEIFNRIDFRSAKGVGHGLRVMKTKGAIRLGWTLIDAIVICFLSTFLVIFELKIGC
jgi:hypothetical protein